jgi:hypothetical protein
MLAPWLLLGWEADMSDYDLFPQWQGEQIDPISGIPLRTIEAMFGPIKNITLHINGLVMPINGSRRNPNGN